MVDAAVVLVNLAMSPQVGYDGEVAATAIDFACECCHNVSDVGGDVLGSAYASRQCGCTCASVANLVV